MQLISALDDGVFEAEEQELGKGSEFFRNMLESCTTSPSATLYESSPTIRILIDLICSPPSCPLKSEDKVPPRDRHGALLYRTEYEPHTVIPLPLLREMLRLVDKYLLVPSTLSILGEHLAAHAHLSPWDVYSLATIYAYDLADPANQASGYIGPLESYDKKDVLDGIKSVEAYHDLVRLQAFRVAEMKKVLLNEDLFPHGYGECSTHKLKMEELWKDSSASLARRLHTHTDVAHAIGSRCMQDVNGCGTCQKAVEAATAMLAYKCRKIPRRLDELAGYKEPY